MSKVLKKGKVVYLSREGHRGFNYPSEEYESLLFDVKVERVSWVGGGKLLPVKIPETALLALGNSSKKVVVWVDKT